MAQSEKLQDLIASLSERGLITVLTREQLAEHFGFEPEILEGTCLLDNGTDPEPGAYAELIARGYQPAVQHELPSGNESYTETLQRGIEPASTQEHVVLIRETLAPDPYGYGNKVKKHLMSVHVKDVKAYRERANESNEAQAD